MGITGLTNTSRKTNMGLPKYPPPPPKHQQPAANPQSSVLLAFETAILLMEQSGMTEEDIMKMAHLVCVGMIRNGNFTPEYYEIAREVMEERRRQDEADARIAALRETVSPAIIKP